MAPLGDVLRHPGMTIDLRARIGPVGLRTPLIGAAGTVGSVVEMAGVTDLGSYGACVAKSVSAEPWPGRPAPRIAPAGAGMLNGIGIQNPGVEAWVSDIAPRLRDLDVPVWGSAVGASPEEFGQVARRLAEAGVDAVELNLSCPNLDDGRMFALDPKRSAEVVRAAREAVPIPIGAKLSPNSEDVVAVAAACADAGADWVVLTNTVWGAAIDVRTRRPVVTGTIGGYSGVPIKPLALRCVIEVHRALPDLPIVGCGGIASGADVVEYAIAGASAVALGTIHFAEPRAAGRILRELRSWLGKLGAASFQEVVGTMAAW